MYDILFLILDLEQSKNLLSDTRADLLDKIIL